MSRSRTRSSDQALILLTSIIVGVAVIGVLYWAQKVLIPVGLALFFAFLLNPVVMQFQRWHLPRVLAVLAVTLLAATVMLGFSWLVFNQVFGLLDELPNYSTTIKQKLESVQELTQGTGLGRLEAMFHDLGSSEPAAVPRSVVRRQPLAHNLEPNQESVPVTIVTAEPLWLRWLPNFFGPATEFLGQFGLVVVLVVFVLLAREDLRNRFIRLVGHGRMTATTKAVDDASQRLSRFLLMQLTINATFGLCVAIGLALIGVRYAVLWGFLAAVLRYVPYIGSSFAALFPIVLSIAQFPGWLQPALVVVLILTLELVTANIFEPLLFGRSIGVSAVALLVAAAFWAFLWGPVGLVLSCPLTVCLVVLGKYVPRLEFLAVLLDDEPALEEDFSYYQRLSAHDQDEAFDIVRQYAKEHATDDVYDALLIPALTYAGYDLQREGLDEEDIHFIHESTREVLQELEELRQEAKAKTNGAAPAAGVSATRDKVRILGVPLRAASDELALEMLRQLLEGEPCELVVASNEKLSSELLTMIEDNKPAAICIATLPPGGLARARFLCKRLRKQFPELRILLGRWGGHKSEEESAKELHDSDLDQVQIQTSLIASRNELVAWLPALAQTAKAAREIVSQ